MVEGKTILEATMCINNSVFAQCDVCGRDIRYGNAILEIGRNVEQHEYEEETDLHSVTIIDADPLVTLCARCGNSMADRKEIWKYLVANLGLPGPANYEDAAQQAEAGLPETCGCCGVELGENRARVSIARLIGQMDWSEKLNDGELSVIDGEDVLSFCPDCGNKMSTRRLKQAFRELIDDTAAPEKYENNDFNDELGLYERKARLLERVLLHADEMDKKDQEQWQLILKVGAEGGCICLYGRKDENGEWQFLRETDERTLSDMLSDEDREGLSFYSKTEPVTGWHNALEILNRYPWPCLYPLYVHQEFSDAVLMGLKNYKGGPCEIDFRHWDAVCAGKDIY